mmetsp:Transcript_21444/g.42084  ORF Transcript_21444/g.42084 Transcript_21444/m.42084 type:complete len:207 (-) Transcript_21444:2128-2748(-)
MVAVGVHAQSRDMRLQGLYNHIELLVGRGVPAGYFDELLHRACSVQVQRRLDEMRLYLLQHDATLSHCGLLKELLKEVVTEGVQHKEHEAASNLIKDNLACTSSICIDLDLEKSTSELFLRQLKDRLPNLFERGLEVWCSHGVDASIHHTGSHLCTSATAAFTSPDHAASSAVPRSTGSATSFASSSASSGIHALAVTIVEVSAWS